MKKYLPVIAGGIILILIVAGFIFIQSKQTKSDLNKSTDSIYTQSATAVSPTQISLKETPTPMVNNISLVINSPTKGAIVKRPNLTVSGKTIPRAEVMVNDVERLADANGNFSANIILDEGENTILVVANDSEGNFAETELVVTYEPE